MAKTERDNDERRKTILRERERGERKKGGAERGETQRGDVATNRGALEERDEDR